MTPTTWTSWSYLAAENMVELGGLELRNETPWLRGGRMIKRDSWVSCYSEGWGER
jgi:hypothetical protein